MLNLFNKKLKHTSAALLPCFMLMFSTILHASEDSPQKRNNAISAQEEKALPKSAFKKVEWTDLIPDDDLQAILNPPSYVTDIEDGSAEDQFLGQIQKDLATEFPEDRYQQALSSTRIKSEMIGKPVKIPGFVVPLEFDDYQTITQFFLVPFFGACIHVPPPPPNQIIFVESEKGFKLEALYDPIWVSGILRSSILETELGTSAYMINMQHMEMYTED